MKKNLYPSITFRLAFLICLTPFIANAQLKGGHILGALGLQSGTQAPENTLAVTTPLYYYTANSLHDDNGDEIAKPAIDMFIAAAGINWVSDIKILGANYGAAMLIPFASDRIQGNEVNSESDLAFSDIYLQPIQLGWHNKRADFFAGYQLYIPTGKYELGGDNSGLGMWMNEFTGGTTVYLNADKTWSAALLASYEINGKKKDTEIKPGDILSLEGGVGKTIYMMNSDKSAPQSILNAGLVYYAQFKMTKDQIPAGPFTVTPGKDHIYGLGAEVDFFNIPSNINFGLRWLTELGAVNRFEGNTFFVTLAYVIETKREENK